MSKICKNCGKEMPDEANICLNCLDVYELEPAETDIKKKKLSKKQIAAIAAAALFIFITPFALYPIYSNGATPVEKTSSSNTNEGKHKKPLSRIEEFFSEAFNGQASSEDNTQPNEDGNLQGKFPSSQNGRTNDSPAFLGKPGSESVQENGGVSTGNPEGSTAAPSTSRPSENQTTTKPVATKPADEKPVCNPADYEYEAEGKGVCITKYKGKNSSIIIPDKLGGKNVVRIKKEAFKDNSTLKYATFKDSEDYHTLWVETCSFYNCSQLKKVTFPKNTDLGILTSFAHKVPQFDDIEVDHWQYRFIDGALYYYDTNNWTLECYCEGCKAQEYHMPEFCAAFNCDNMHYNNLAENKYLKRIYLNDREHYPECTSLDYPYLEGVYAPKDSKYLFDVDGVIFAKNATVNGEHDFKLYPMQKKDKSFTFPENSYVSFGAHNNNDYVETIVLPASCRFSDADIDYINYRFKNLKTVKISKNNPQLQRWKNTFIGTVTVY